MLIFENSSYHRSVSYLSVLGYGSALGSPTMLFLQTNGQVEFGRLPTRSSGNGVYCESGRYQRGIREASPKARFVKLF